MISNWSKGHLFLMWAPAGATGTLPEFHYYELLLI